MSNTISSITPVVDIADTRSSTAWDHFTPIDHEVSRAVELGETIWHEEVEEDQPGPDGPLLLQRQHFVALPEGHVFGRTEDVTVWGAFPYALPQVPGAWDELRATHLAEWCARKLGLVGGTWSVAAERRYRDRGVDIAWRGLHVTPGAASCLEELGITPERFNAQRHDRELWTMPSPRSIATWIRRREREDRQGLRAARRLSLTA